MDKRKFSRMNRKRMDEQTSRMRGQTAALYAFMFTIRGNKQPLASRPFQLRWAKGVWRRIRT
jgi:hypothetical protein